MKTYEEKIAWLFRQFPSYQTVGGVAYKPGIETMEAFDEALGHPHRRFRSIHIAGTNGKGSTSHMLAAGLAARKSVNAELLYELKNGKLLTPESKKEKYPIVQHGFPILTGALHMKDGWKKYDSFGFEFEEGLDLSALVEQDYYLELYLKNTDPTLTFDYHLEISQSDTSVGNPPMYGTGTNARDLKNDGDWERICIPLSRFELWDRTQNNYWNRITKFVFITTSTGGQEFFVKDIRIRRVLPE